MRPKINQEKIKLCEGKSMTGNKHYQHQQYLIQTKVKKIK